MLCRFSNVSVIEPHTYTCEKYINIYAMNKFCCARSTDQKHKREICCDISAKMQLTRWFKLIPFLVKSFQLCCMRSKQNFVSLQFVNVMENALLISQAWKIRPNTSERTNNNLSLALTVVYDRIQLTWCRRTDENKVIQMTRMTHQNKSMQYWITSFRLERKSIDFNVFFFLPFSLIDLYFLWTCVKR